ncbi:MAG: DUF2062 domain-containing protein [Bacteroidia bacterium]|nr:DUF2062 domain-containing protein [Bacteroidia bacterium]
MILYYLAGIFVLSIIIGLIVFWRMVIIRTPKHKLPDIYYREKIKAGEDFYLCGRNWLNRNKYGLWELYIEGNALERGIAAGKLTEELIEEQENIFYRQLNEFVKSLKYLHLLRLIIAWINRKIDKFIDEEFRKEIFGISLYAPKKYRFIAENYQRYLNYHAAHDIGRVLQDMQLTACTAFAAWGNKTANRSIIAGRNFDFYLGGDFSRSKIISFYNPDIGYPFVMIGWGGMVGVVSGMNMAGLTLTINGAISKIPHYATTPTSILGREIIQFASTINEAYIIAEKRKLFVSESYLICSAKENRAVIIEKNPYTTSLYETSNDFIVCTNHFQSDIFKNDAMNRENIEKSDSVARFNRVTELIQKNQNIDPHTIATILRNRYGYEDKAIGLGNEKTINQMIGHHSVIFSPGDLKIWFSTYPYQLGEYICYDLKKIISEYSGLSVKAEIFEQEKTIPADPFITTAEYKNFIRFRKNISPIPNERNRYNKNFDEKDLPELISSNPEYYSVYNIAGDYYSAKNNYLNALHYYKIALSKEISTAWEKERIEKKLDRINREISGFSNVVHCPYNKPEPINKSVYNRFKEKKCCVIIPTYNNCKTLENVITKILEFTAQIIIVNDGSIDCTDEILSRYNYLHIISYNKNRGKGYALRKGFNYAVAAGFDYAITIDSDGQHSPEELLSFLEAVEKAPDAIIVGARNMERAEIPGKSSFGHKLSNFWFRFETGIWLPDTQSGYRLYPLNFIKNFTSFTNKYEFEIEVLVRAAWKGIKITSIPISVHYGTDRITHFRPFKDFSRVSLLNAYFVLISLLYIKPFQFVQGLKKKTFREFWEQYIIKSDESNAKITAAVMLGVFMAVTPIWGWQLAVAVTIAHFLRLNKVIVIVSSHISIPPMIPFVLYLSYILGGFILNTGNFISYSSSINFIFIANNLFQYIVGSIVLGFVLAIISGIFIYFILAVFRKK